MLDGHMPFQALKSKRKGNFTQHLFTACYPCSTLSNCAVIANKSDNLLRLFSYQLLPYPNQQIIWHCFLAHMSAQHGCSLSAWNSVIINEDILIHFLVPHPRNLTFIPQYKRPSLKLTFSLCVLINRLSTIRLLDSLKKDKYLKMLAP